MRKNVVSVTGSEKTQDDGEEGEDLPDQSPDETVNDREGDEDAKYQVQMIHGLDFSRTT